MRSIGIGGRPPLARMRPFDEVFDVIADIASMLAVGRPPALDPHLLQRILGEPEPGGRLNRVEERLVRFPVIAFRGHPTFLPTPTTTKRCEKKRRQIGGVLGSGEEERFAFAILREQSSSKEN